MEEMYLFAKKIVDKKFDKSNCFYYMYICSLFGLLMKYPDYKDLIRDVFINTRIIIEDKTVLEIQDEYDLQLIKQEELDVQDADVCINHGVSDLGFGVSLTNGKLEITDEKPTLVCSSKTVNPTDLLNVFTHELNHIIKGQLKAYGSRDDEDISFCFTRCGLSYTSFTYNKNTDILLEDEYYSILDEVINVFQTKDIMFSILTLDGIVPDTDFQKYFDTLDKDELVKVNGYEKCCELFSKIWKNPTLKELLEEHLVDGELDEIANDFNNTVGIECFDVMADYFDDLDYLFCLNNNKKNYEKCYKKLRNLIGSITTAAYKLNK